MMLQITLLGLADAYPAADGRSRFYDEPMNYENYPLGHSEVAFTNTYAAQPKGNHLGGLQACPTDAYVCPETGITLTRDPRLNCEFDYALCSSGGTTTNEHARGHIPLQPSIVPPHGLIVPPETPGSPHSDHAGSCATERQKAWKCWHKVIELGHVFDKDWPFFSNDLASLADQELYIRGCYVYTTGSLQGKAFYGGDGAKAPPTRVQMIDTQCSEPAENPTTNTVSGKNPRAKGGSVLGVGPVSPTLESPTYELNPSYHKGVNPAWIIIPSVFGAFLIVVAGLCLRKKGCCSLCSRGKEGYDTPEAAQKTDAQMDSVECPAENDAEDADKDSESTEAPKSRCGNPFFCCSRKKADAQPESVELGEVKTDESSETPESPNAYSDILKEAFNKAADEDNYMPRNSELEDRVTLSVGSPSDGENTAVEDQFSALSP